LVPSYDLAGLSLSLFLLLLLLLLILAWRLRAPAVVRTRYAGLPLLPTGRSRLRDEDG
jgi:hypothetical protein